MHCQREGLSLSDKLGKKSTDSQLTVQLKTAGVKKSDSQINKSREARQNSKKPKAGFKLKKSSVFSRQ